MMTDINTLPKAQPMLLAVAPNGARKQYSDHVALPITPDELAQTAKTCHVAGAGMMHVHVRDDSHRHCIDAKRYHEAFAAIRDNVDQALFLQATTEAVGQYQPQEQIAMIQALIELQRGLGTFGVSLAVREVMSKTVADKHIAELFQLMRANHVLPQLIIYDTADLQRFQQLLSDGILVGRGYPCLFVLGRYSNNQQSNPAELLPFFTDMSGVSSWMGCAFGAREYDVAMTAALLGGQMRIGYENNVHLADGSVSNNNAELILQAAKGLTTWQRRIADSEETLAMMTPDWLE